MRVNLFNALRVQLLVIQIAQFQINHLVCSVRYVIEIQVNTGE